MGMIINIDQALKERSHYNVLKEPLHKMLKDEQEAWEKENPIDLIFVRNTITSFQETYTSSIGFAHAFTETSDFAVGPIFNQAEGFTATYRTKTFQGGFIITQQTLEDGQYGRVKDEASAFGRRWRADVVEYAMKSLEGAFGVQATFQGGDGKNSYIKLESADTTDGDINTATKNPLFTNAHKTVKRPDGVGPIEQTNLYYLDIDSLDGEYNKISTVAKAINTVITDMENRRDDNGKITGVNGAKRIVGPNNAHLKALINTALQTDMFKYGDSDIINLAYQRANADYTPYLNDICEGKCIFIVDKAYNEANHGPEFTERIPFTLDATELKRPNGIAYDGRQRFDINTASWRGISCIYLGNPKTKKPAWASTADMFTEISADGVISMPVNVTNASEVGA